MNRLPRTAITRKLTLAVLLLLAHVTRGQGQEGMFDDYSNDVLDYRAKRLFTDSSNECLRCISSYDSVSCQRCWTSKSLIVPYHGKRSGPATPGGQHLIRLQRSSGCGCCYMSRFSNHHCCHVCSLTAKRTDKRSAVILPTDLLNLSF